MLEYLNGIGGPRKKIFSKIKSLRNKEGRKKLLAKLPASATAIKMIKEGKGKLSPLMKSKLMKFAVEQKRRAKMDVEGEPLQIAYDYDNQIEQGVKEIDQAEFNYFSTHGEMGLIYPVEIGGRRDRRIKKKETREKRKQERSERKNIRVKSKAEARQTKAEAKRLRGEGKRLKGEKGGFDFKGALDTVATTAKDVFGKGGEVKEAFEDFKSGASARTSSADSTATTSPDLTQPTTEQSFFEKNKMPLLIGGAVLVAGGLYLATRKKK